MFIVPVNYVVIEEFIVLDNLTIDKVSAKLDPDSYYVHVEAFCQASGTHLTHIQWLRNEHLIQDGETYRYVYWTFQQIESIHSTSGY